MIKQDFLLQEIKRLTERLAETHKRLQQGERAIVSTELDELLQESLELWAQGGEDERVRPLLAQIHGEMGMVAGLAGATGEAESHLSKGIDYLEPLLGRADDGIERLYLTALLNAGAMTAAGRNFDDATSYLTTAIDRVQGKVDLAESPSGDDEVEEVSSELIVLWISALHNRSALSLQVGDVDLASADLTRATEAAEKLVDGGLDRGLEILAECYLRLTALARKRAQNEEALEIAEKAMAATARTVELEIGRFPLLFVRARVALADCHFALGAYSEAEDHIFAAVEAIPALIDTVLVAIGFYADLCRMSDETLEAGGLPRDEVVDSFSELLASLDANCEDEMIKSLVHARFDLLVNDDREAATKLTRLEHQPGTVDPRVPALTTVLRSDLNRV